MLTALWTQGLLGAVIGVVAWESISWGSLFGQLGLTLGNVLVYPGSADSIGCAALMGVRYPPRASPAADIGCATSRLLPPLFVLC